MRVLVVGGAGYIGSVTLRALLEAGHDAYALDNLSRGHTRAVPEGRLFRGGLGDRGPVRDILKDRRIDAVMHFAAFAYVGESVEDPGPYWRNNVSETLALLEVMQELGINRFVFSSTCATFGNPVKVPIDEDHPQNPISPYGWSKLTVEKILTDMANAYDLMPVSLRYFNASGATVDGKLGEAHDPEYHLLPRAIQVALRHEPSLTVYGEDYDTPDGTCIRDYVHVEDLARAHIAALERLGSLPRLAYNLGTGKGSSVKEVIDTVEAVTGGKIPVVKGDRREGDPPELVAAPDRAMKDLEWEPRIPDLEGITKTAFRWHAQGGFPNK